MFARIDYIRDTLFEAQLTSSLCALGACSSTMVALMSRAADGSECQTGIKDYLLHQSRRRISIIVS